MDDGDDMIPIQLYEDRLVAVEGPEWRSRSRGPTLLSEAASWEYRSLRSMPGYASFQHSSSSWELYVIMSECRDFR